jgi:hypothetical protein
MGGVICRPALPWVNGGQWGDTMCAVEARKESKVKWNLLARRDWYFGKTCFGKQFVAQYALGPTG